jgi:hypothetical protein
MSEGPAGQFGNDGPSARPEDEASAKAYLESFKTKMGELGRDLEKLFRSQDGEQIEVEIESLKSAALELEAMFYAEYDETIRPQFDGAKGAAERFRGALMEQFRAEQRLRDPE